MEILQRNGDDVSCGVAGYENALLVVGTLRGSLYAFSRIEKQPLADSTLLPEPQYHVLTYAKAAHARAVRCVALSESSGRIATGSDDASICVVPVQDLVVEGHGSVHHHHHNNNTAGAGSRHGRIRAHRLPVTQVQWNTAGDLLFSSSYDGVFSVHRIRGASTFATTTGASAANVKSTTLFDDVSVETVCEVRVGFAVATFCMTPDETTAFVAGESAARVDLLHGLRIDTTCHRNHSSESSFGVAFGSAGGLLAWAGRSTVGGTAERSPVTRLSWCVAEGCEREAEGKGTATSRTTSSVDDLWDWSTTSSSTRSRGALIRRIRYGDRTNSIEVEASLGPEVCAPAKRWAWAIEGGAGTAWTTYHGAFQPCTTSTDGSHGAALPQVVRAFLDSMPKGAFVAAHATKSGVTLAGGADRDGAGGSVAWSLGHPNWSMPVWSVGGGGNTGRWNRSHDQAHTADRSSKIVAFEWPRREADASPTLAPAPRLSPALSAPARRRPREDPGTDDDNEAANVERAAARVAALEATCSQLGARLKELLGMDHRD